ncbi:MAG TPA: hypothetical protein VFG42_12240 [Baekduia sp.]|uniref:hypothetical protein n=1 Tax=Baekduia sp. TaxID=2600305 RepID=UPI002D785A21|nr:hypothetical protein [Baekduia sp.]HET6507549.1 hypothetical protein [Baekduia sp.]
MSRLATPLSVLAIAGASVALVACGSSGDSSSGADASATTKSGANGTQNAAFEKYRQCLKDNGVTLPDRGQRPNGGDGNGGGYGPPPGADGGDGQPPTGTNAQPPTGTDGAPPSDGNGNGGGAGGPGFFGGGQPDAKTQKAMQACAKLRPQFRGGGYGDGTRNGGGRPPQQNIKAFTPYLTCLKDQGLDVKVSDGFNALRNLKASDPKVQAAFKTCQSKLPQRPGGGNGRQQTSTTGSTT